MKYRMIFFLTFLAARCFAMDGNTAFETVMDMADADDGSIVPPALSRDSSSELNLTSDEDIEAILKEFLPGNDPELKEAAIGTLRGMDLKRRREFLSGAKKGRLKKRKSSRAHIEGSDQIEKAKDVVTSDQIEQVNDLMRKLLVHVSQSNKKLNDTLAEQAKINKQLSETNDQLHQDKSKLGKTVSEAKVKLWIAFILAAGGVVAAGVTGGITALTC